MTNLSPAKFDGLADDYDQARPRYPRSIFEPIFASLPSHRPLRVVDAGAGTGIELETLLPLLPTDSEIHCVDISRDMISKGKAKFPQASWHLRVAEDFMAQQRGTDMVIAAQAYQCMDRPRFLSAARQALRPEGVCVIAYNDRDFRAGGFAEAFEDLLEKYSPGYSRYYREVGVVRELKSQFVTVDVVGETWERSFTVEEFVTMSVSSTRVQRAIAETGDKYLDLLRELCGRYAQDGELKVGYVSEAFYGVRGDR